MLPGLIAARVIFSKVAGGGGLARPHIRRPLHIRRAAVLHPANASHRRLSSNPSTRTRWNRSMVNSSTSSSSESESSGIDTKSRRKIDHEQNILGWIPIYRFDFIHWAGLISRFKIAQTIVVVGFVPVVVYMYQQNQASLEAVTAISALGGLALVMLYAMSSLLRRCIGVISIHPNMHEIRIGYLTFWGWRRNVIIPIDDVVPLNEANSELGPNRQRPAFVQVKRYSDTNFRLYLPMWKFSIVDKEAFENVFGEIVSGEAKKKS